MGITHLWIRVATSEKGRTDGAPTLARPDRQSLAGGNLARRGRVAATPQVARPRTSADSHHIRRPAGHGCPRGPGWTLRACRRGWPQRPHPRVRRLSAPPRARDSQLPLAHAILNYLWRMSGDEQTAYDLTQEVFLRAWRHYATIRGYDQPRAWFFRVATNLAVSHARRRVVVAVDLLDVARTPAASDPAWRLAERDPAWRLAERDLVRQVLQQLPPKRRAALVLCEVCGLSAAETGRILKMSAAAVRMALSRARDQFAELYLREEGRDHGH
ncbi:MAG TPA: RNA polymerase sigma factor [Ktedonobacterales bacterium]